MALSVSVKNHERLKINEVNMQLKTLRRENQISRIREIIKLTEINSMEKKKEYGQKSQKPLETHKIVKSLIKLMKNTRIDETIVVLEKVTYHQCRRD